MKATEKREIEDKVIEVLKGIFDPEIPVNIYDLGLIYDVTVKDSSDIDVLMTLTSPNCPVAESLPVEVKEKIRTVEEVQDVEVELTFEPTWTKEMMSEEAKLELGFM